MRKLFKERKLFKGGNYMRKYGILVYLAPESMTKNSIVTEVTQFCITAGSKRDKLGQNNNLYLN